MDIKEIQNKVVSFMIGSIPLYLRRRKHRCSSNKCCGPGHRSGRITGRLYEVVQLPGLSVRFKNEIKNSSFPQMDLPRPLQATRLWVAFAAGHKANQGGCVGN